MAKSIGIHDETGLVWKRKMMEDLWSLRAYFVGPPAIGFRCQKLAPKGLVMGHGVFLIASLRKET